MNEKKQPIVVESQIRGSLLGFRIKPFLSPPIFQLKNNWNVFDAGKLSILPPDDRRLNDNYQIEREKEKILVRTFLKNNEIVKVKYFYIKKNTDDEIAFLITMALLMRLSVMYPLASGYLLIRFGF